MVFIQTVVRVIDNSGGFYAKCIGILTNSKLARVGDALAITIKSILLNKKITHRKKRKVLKGTVRRAVLLKTSWIQKRWGNCYFRMLNKGVAIIGTWDMPIGNRIYGPIYFEARLTKYIKIAMLAEGSY
jgi:ribosomal protein L14